MKGKLLINGPPIVFDFAFPPNIGDFVEVKVKGKKRKSTYQVTAVIHTGNGNLLVEAD